MINIFVINLEKSVERKQQILSQLKSIPIDFNIQFVKAIDKNVLNDAEIAKYCDFSIYERRSIGEIACALSHRLVYQKIIDEKIDFAVVLEDDVMIKEYFFDVVRELYNKYKSECLPCNSIIKLDSEKPGSLYSRIKITKQGRITYSVKIPVREVTFAWGYCIDNAACSTFLTQWPKMCFVADEYKVIKKKINLLLLQPTLITENPTFSCDSIILQRGKNESISIGSNTEKLKLKTKIKNFFLKIIPLKILGISLYEK